MGAMGGVFWVLSIIAVAVALVVGLVWLYFSIRFFSKATEYCQMEINHYKRRDEDTKELLAKLDQLVDVLKVK
jgi:uncharacterized membrane protein